MSWQQWFYLGYAIAGSVVSVSMIGKPRAPLEPPVVAFMLVFQGLMAWLVLSI